jgi:hypothetical protein
MAKLDPDLVKKFVGADDSKKLAILREIDAETREMLIEFLDAIAAPEASPTAEPPPKTTWKPADPPSLEPPESSSGLDADGFMISPIELAPQKAVERKHDEAGFLLGDRPRSVFPYRSPRKGGTHWSN